MKKLRDGLPLLPFLAVVVIFLIIPTVTVIGSAFFADGQFSLARIQALFSPTALAALWKSVLLSGSTALIGAVLGFIIGLVLGVLGAPKTLLQTTTGLAGAAVGLIWSIVCLRMALEKKYSDFRIALLPRETGRN